MKYLLFIITLISLFSCERKVTIENYNKNPDIKGIEKYLKYAGENYNYKYKEVPVSDSEKKTGVEKIDRWDFKLKKPVVRDNANYFYRFSVKVTKYRNSRDNHGFFRAVKKDCKTTDNKGFHNFTLCTGVYILQLSSDCLMNRILNRHFKKVVEYVLGVDNAEPGSVIHHSCGGFCKIQ